MLTGFFWVVMSCSPVDSYHCSSDTFATTAYKTAWHHSTEGHNQEPQILQKLVILTSFSAGQVT